ncbi:MAG TPA: universal stress protein [Gammaproteobacteria bacterium]
MREPKRILAVVDPTAASQPAVERAAALAKNTRARLELFICDYDPQLVDSAPSDHRGLAAMRSVFVENRWHRLREIAKTLVALDAPIELDVRWDSPLADGIVRKALESSADIVFKDTHYHPRLKRSVFSNTDWNLIRDCPTLLWLAKPRAIAAKPRLIAAVDPLHERAKPTELDDRIIAATKQVCYPLNGELHVVHAFDVTPALATPMDPMATPPPIREITDSMRARHTEAVHELTDAHGIPRDCVHVHAGSTRAVVVELTEKLRADVVVMGGISRRGLKRLFLGNTAEETLDELSCDLLIVKPAGFETSVPR